MYRRISTFNSPTQLTLIDNLGTLTNQPMTYGAEIDRRLCQPGETRETVFAHNIMRNVAMPMSAYPGTVNAPMQNSFGPRFAHNLIHNAEPNKWSNITGGGLAVQAMMFFSPAVMQMTIDHNTMIGGPAGGINYAFYFEKTNPGDTVITNNVVGKLGSTGGLRNTWTDVKNYVCGGAVCPDAQWSSNVFAGARLNGTVGYPSGTINQHVPGSVHNLCSNGTECNNPDYSLLFSDYARDKWGVKNSSAFKRKATDGSDYGADFSQLPRIERLVVTPTDRLVMFRYRVANPIAHIPCVAEISSGEDFLSYAGELGSIATHYGRDSDEFDGFPRSLTERTIVIGDAVPLAGRTKYYYRLHCGGDMRSGEVTTQDNKTAGVRLDITRYGAGSMTWGYAYSRATDMLTGSDAVSCAANVCSAVVQRGRVV